jgi:hypothetical protein
MISRRCAVSLIVTASLSRNSEFRIPNSEFVRSILPPVTDPLLPPPLARWDGLHLVVDLELAERHLNRALAGNDRIRDLRLRGAGDALEAEITVVWKGVAARVGVQLAEIRLRHRHLGFRMRRLRALGGLPVPRLAVERGLMALESPVVTVFQGQGIVVLDLRRWLPGELDLQVVTVQATLRALHVWFGPGRLNDLPGQSPGRLPPGGSL